MDPSSSLSPARWLGDAPIRSDREDLLGYRRPAERLAHHLHEAHPGSSSAKVEHSGAITVSLEGPWGSGKTSFANLLVNALKSKPRTDPLVVYFNVWQSASMEIPPWYALAYRLGEAAYDRLRRRCLGKKVEIGNPLYEPGGQNDLSTITYDFDVSAKYLGDVKQHWIEISRRLALEVPPDKWHPCLKLFNDAPSRLGSRAWTSTDLRTSLTATGSAAFALAQNDFKTAGANVREAVENVAKPDLVEGPAWGFDTLEFVRDLDRLLYVLHPGSRTWRVILLVDDVNRIDAEELPGVLDALGYINALHDVLTIVNLDDRVVEKMSHHMPDGVNESAYGESFLDRLIHLRHRIPEPNLWELSRILAKNSPIPDLLSWDASVLVRRFFVDRMPTPRQLKSAFRWLYPRYQHMPASALDNRDLIDCLSRIYRYVHGNTDGEAVIESLAGKTHLLRLFGVQPWDLRGWPDKCGLLPLADRWEVATEETERLIEAIRLRALCVHCGMGRSHPAFGPTRFRAWADKIREKHLVALHDFDWGQPLEGFFDSLLEALRRSKVLDVARLHHAKELTSAARRVGFFEQEEQSLALTGDFEELLRGAAYDLDRLWRLANAPEVPPEWAAKACLMAVVLAPGLYQEYNAVWDRRYFAIPSPISREIHEFLQIWTESYTSSNE